MPFRVAPGIGAVNLDFALAGEQLDRRWAIASNKVSWTPDTSVASVQRPRARGLAGGLGDRRSQGGGPGEGTIKNPKLSVASNLDDAIANRLKAVIGEEVAKAEAMARAKVDSLVQDKVEPVKQRIAAVQADASKRIGVQTQQLDQVREAAQGGARAAHGAGWRRGSSCPRSSCKATRLPLPGYPAVDSLLIGH